MAPPPSETITGAGLTTPLPPPRNTGTLPRNLETPSGTHSVSFGTATDGPVLSENPETPPESPPEDLSESQDASENDLNYIMYDQGPPSPVSHFDMFPRRSGGITDSPEATPEFAKEFWARKHRLSHENDGQWHLRNMKNIFLKIIFIPYLYRECLKYASKNIKKG